GLTEEHQKAIKEWSIAEPVEAKEIIFFFDNDTAGKEAVQKYGAMLNAEYPKLKLTTAEPISKDINETLQGHDESIFLELLNNRTELIFSNEQKDSAIPRNDKQTVILNEAKRNEESQGITNKPIDFLKRKHLLKNL